MIVDDSFDFCYIYTQSVRNGQVASVGSSASFPRRGQCPQVTDIREMYESWEYGLMLEFADYKKCRKVSCEYFKRRNPNILLNWSLTSVRKHHLIVLVMFSFVHFRTFVVFFYFFLILLLGPIPFFQHY